MSRKGSLKEAMYNFYYLLRKAENIKCKNIFITNLEECKELISDDIKYFDSLFDKVYRSCSGRGIFLKNKENN